MDIDTNNIQLSRGHWTIARYIKERATIPMPPVAKINDDALHITKLAVNAPVPRAVYVIDDDERYLGTISDSDLVKGLFVHLDPSLYLETHPRALASLVRLQEDASKLTASSLMDNGPMPILDTETVIDAMRALYRRRADELPVTDASGRLVGVIRALDILRDWLEDTLLVKFGDETESYY